MNSPLARDAAVQHLLAPLRVYMEKHPDATDVYINRPGEVFVEENGMRQRYNAPELDFAWANSLATVVATYTEQVINAGQPILSAMLPNGERMQIMLPPATEADKAAIAIRVPRERIAHERELSTGKSLSITLDDYVKDGAFDKYAWAMSERHESHKDALKEDDRLLWEQLAAGNLKTFLHWAVLAKKSIAVIGDTGSGKTTLMKAMCQVIPRHERLYVVEDVRELFLPDHPNTLFTLYSKGHQGTAEITPTDLIASALRVKPDRILLAEVRGSEAWDYLKALSTGHAGSITSFHAADCRTAHSRLLDMCLEHRDLAGRSIDMVREKIAATVDILIHMTARAITDNGRPRVLRYVEEVMFDPIAALTYRGPATHTYTAKGRVDGVSVSYLRAAGVV